jgi:hypothetical protein
MLGSGFSVAKIMVSSAVYRTIESEGTFEQV